MKLSSEESLDELGTLQEYIEETILQWRNKVLSVEKFYKEKYGLLFEERRRIVSGEVEPLEEAIVEGKSVGGEEETLGANREGGTGGGRDADEKGLPHFWLTVLKNQDTTSEFVEERDEAALRHLTDIRCLTTREDPGYRLEFHFSKNPYFSNKALVKEIQLPSQEVPLSSAIVKTTPGIQWKSQELNLTLRAVTKTSKHKKAGKGKGRKDTAADAPAGIRYKPCASFFGFFSAESRHTRGRGRQAPESEEDEEEEGNGREEAEDEGEDGDGRLVSDKQAALLQALCHQVIPNAVEIYLSGGLASDDMDGIDGTSSAATSLEDHPPAKQRRLRALLRLHAQREELQKLRLEEVERAQASCDEDLATAYARRRKLVVGDQTGKAGAGDEAQDNGAAAAPQMNLPRFWLLVLKGCPTTVELIRRRDEAVLEYLADVRCVRSGLSTFRVEFEFCPNPFFSDAVLAKEFTLDAEEELLTDSRATPVDWRDPDTDVTIRHTPAQNGTRLKPTPSFFHLFGTGAKALQLLFAGDDRVQLSAPKLLELETNLAVALRDMVVADALAMYRSALTYDMADSDANSDDEDYDVDEDEEGLDPDEIRRRLKGRAKRRKGDDSSAVCCGLSKTSVLVILLVLPMTAQLVMYMDFWHSHFRFW